jgi:hypothetical protein
MPNLLNMTIELRLPLFSCGDSKVPPGMTTLLDTDDFNLEPGTRGPGQDHCLILVLRGLCYYGCGD